MIDNSSGENIISGKKVRDLINAYLKFLEDENLTRSQETFFAFLEKKYKIIPKKEKELKADISQKWDRISERISLIEKIERKVFNTLIGIIYVTNTESSDTQNIFKLINNTGEDLLAVEILSAKPSWNQPIVNYSNALKEKVILLYTSLAVPRDEKIVRWDFAATLMDRLDSLNKTIFKPLCYSESEFGTKLTLGFKLLSAVYENGVTKDNISNLSKNSKIDWEQGLDGLVKDLKEVGELIFDFSYFKYFKSWNISLMSLTTEAIAINFIVITYLDWIKKEKPSRSSTKLKRFQKNAFILFDQLIYEHLLRQWRGSSDSKISQNITDFKKSSSESFATIRREQWMTILNELLQKNSILDKEVKKHNELSALLYHTYCLNKKYGPAHNDPTITIDIDHIIPVSKFEISDLPKKEIIKNSIYNLGLLPKKENIGKGNKTLLEVSGNDWIVNQIKEYEGIEKKRFPELSDLNNLAELKALRSPFYTAAFGKNRDFILNN